MFCLVVLRLVCYWGQVGGSAGLRTLHVPRKPSESKRFIYSFANTTLISIYNYFKGKKQQVDEVPGLALLQT